ncbi:MAG: ATP-binding cassette domain-containing protein [Bacilli bacterium]
MGELVTLEDVRFRYPESSRDALGGVNVTLKENQWYTVLGANGSGKSTFAKLLCGLYLPTDGQVRHRDGTVLDEDTRLQFLDRFGLVFQNPDNQFFSTTVLEDLTFTLEQKKLPAHEIKKRLDEITEEFGIAPLLERHPQQLSGGQKQKVALASLLMNQPQLIILDEATSMLDGETERSILAFVHRMQRSYGLTVVHITHDFESFLYSDEILYVEEGTMSVIGSIEALINEQQLPLQLERMLPHLYAFLRTEGNCTKDIRTWEEWMSRE